MGNTSRKLAAKCTLLTKEEQKDVAATFRIASKNSDKIREDELTKHWGPHIDPRLTQYLINYLFGHGVDKTTFVDFNRFAELYVYNVRGSSDERLDVTYSCLGMESNAEVPYQLIKEYCESIASTYMKMQKSLPESEQWTSKGFRMAAFNVQALGEAVASSIADEERTAVHHCTPKEISRWLQINSLFTELSQAVFMCLYNVGGKRSEQEVQSVGNQPSACMSMLPRPEGLESMPDYPAFIDLSHIVWLNAQLPRVHQHKWRFLFSSHIHGESFSTMAGRIIEQGPSIIIIEDHNHCIFGGFASQPWCFSPNWQGTEESFVFSLAPRMRVYHATNYNNHYQYLNHQTKTLPNGLLMGGQFGFGAIWLSADPFGHGSTAESCSTFKGYRRLSKEPEFKIRSLEVWGVGDKPVIDEEQKEPSSILDKSPDAKALLEMTGRSQHSVGLREES